MLHVIKYKHKLDNCYLGIQNCARVLIELNVLKILCQLCRIFYLQYASHGTAYKMVAATMYIRCVLLSFSFILLDAVTMTGQIYYNVLLSLKISSFMITFPG